MTRRREDALTDEDLDRIARDVAVRCPRCNGRDAKCVECEGTRYVPMHPDDAVELVRRLARELLAARHPR